MSTFKLTYKRGGNDLKDIVVSAGGAEAQTDTISLNVDVTNMSKGELLTALDEIKQKVFNLPFPPL